MATEIKQEGAITFDGMIVGEFRAEENRVILNLGWARLAGLRLTLTGDPDVDRKRIVLERPNDPQIKETHEQPTLDLASQLTPEAVDQAKP